MGTTFATRRDATRAGVHRVTVQGIYGNGRDGAESIVVNGGYEDDEDLGDQIIYTGAGGNDSNTGRQIADQTLSQAGNAGLVVSEENGYPVRVIRGFRGDKAQSPTSGYRYDGLYRVDAHWSAVGKSGYRVWMFRLFQLSPAEAAPYIPVQNLPPGTQLPQRVVGIAQRIVRSTTVTNAVKRMYNYACQICGLALDAPVTPYAEGAHIRALGRPHNGPDVPENVLCLCPNHHTLFDLGGVYVDANLDVHDHHGSRIGPLTVHHAHAIDPAHLSHHRTRFGF